MLAADWQNPLVSLDVNDDGAVSPVDALIPINYLIEHGSQPVSEPRTSDEPYRDVSGDNHISPVDALQVINAIIGGFQLPITLNDPGQTSNETSITIGLGQDRGSRTYRFELNASFDQSDSSSSLEDVFSVYLVDKDDPSTTLLDRGVNGTSLFSLAGDHSDFVPGVVRFDGDVVEIDLTSVDQAEQGRLLFQLLNSDGDNGTSVTIRPTENVVDEDGVQSLSFPASQTIAKADSPLDFEALTRTESLSTVITNVRYDRTNGEYRAELRIRNDGAATGRDIAVEFTELPQGVALRNATGTSPSDHPYISFEDAIPPGGIDRGATSDAIEVIFDIVDNTRFPWTVELWSGSPNQAPLFDPVDAITAVAGKPIEVALLATDPDEDPVAFSLTPSATMPTLKLQANGTLRLMPTPGEIGEYSFAVHASDGALKSTQTVQVQVVEEAVRTTRISGQVLNTDSEPLVGVPIAVGRFQTASDADGFFTIELPSFTVPTESLDIPVPQGDSHFDPIGTGLQSIPLHRAGYDVTTGTSAANPRRHPNLVTTFIDGSVVYGSDSDRAAALRQNDGSGKLKTSAGDLLPLNDAATFPEGTLENENNSPRHPATLFAAGDVRANENPALASLHTVLVREHNRRAEELALADPQLSGDELYQQARAWVTAILQHVTYDEFLPLLLGEGALSAYSDYDANVDPSISALFSGAAFRFGHSTAIPKMELLGETGNPLPNSPLSLRDVFFNPEPLKVEGIEPILRGMAAQQIEELDSMVIDDLRNFLFGPPGAGGLDLVSLNIQRGRDLGLPSYNDVRRELGLSAAASFADVSTNANVQANLSSIYDSVENIDLWVGGLAEDHVTGAFVGETFWTIIRDQFERLRDGDRFWYENEQFDVADLSAIRATSLSSLIARNTSIASLPASVFTTQTVPAPFGDGGSAATTAPREVRSIDGSGNNIDHPDLGKMGTNLLVDYTPAYGDRISSPAGADRHGAREISNAVLAQQASVPNSIGATHMFAIWGQLLTHDTNLTPGGTEDTLRIHAETLTGDNAYPFVAEKLPLVLEHDVFIGVNNVIDRPIYLPVLDVGNGTTIETDANTMVMQEIAPGDMASVFVEAGTLQDRAGKMFDGVLSITEVPRELTPAALPSNVMPDAVVTIQPAEMVFTTPAPLTLPNRAGYAPETEMDLWSINPLTGTFGIVGKARVSADGTTVETIEGGIRNSSWHFTSPTPEDLEDETQEPECACTKPTVIVGSEAELGSGAYIEEHQTVTYQSLGETRGVTLRYDSARANPVSVLRFSYDVNDRFLPNGMMAGNSVMMARATFSGNGTTFESPGIGVNEFGFRGSENFWNLQGLRVGQRTGAALGVDFNDVPTGFYQYQLESGIYQRNDSTFAGSSDSVDGGVASVNLIDSPFGSGWSIAGLQQVFEDTGDLTGRYANSVLLVDGDGSELLFRLDFESDEPRYVSPPGDFSMLEKLGDGTFRRTMTNGMIYQFDQDGLLSTVTDRNQNEMRYEYNASGDIERIIDPVGLETVFTYINGRVMEIEDPAGRVTKLDYDSAGNLQQITDPDETTRRFGYDEKHLLRTETNKRGHIETVDYDSAGRVTSGIRADGSRIQLRAAQSQGLFSTSRTTNLDNLPNVERDFDHSATIVDGNGRVMNYGLTPSGLARTASDSLGQKYELERDELNRVTAVVDGNGDRHQYTYDERGNVVGVADEVVGLAAVTGPLFRTPHFPVGGGMRRAVHLAHIDRDEYLDVVTANDETDEVSILLGRGDGTFSESIELAVGASPFAVATGDFNGDGLTDIVTANRDSDDISILLNGTAGTFAPDERVTVGTSPRAVATGDFNEDGILDLVVVNEGDDNVSLLLGVGDGTFSAQQVFTVGDGPRALVVSDIDDDEHVDVAVTNGVSDDVSILFGLGDGSFQNQKRLIAGDTVLAIAVGDVDANGTIDLAVANERDDDVSLFLGIGDGTFAPEVRLPVGRDPLSVVIGDINNDGFVDIATGNEVGDDASILLGDGTGSFAAEQQIGFGDPEFIALGDLDNDGNNDLVGARYDSGVTVALGMANETFNAHRIAVGEGFGYVVTQDFNKDGLQDIAVADFSNEVSILLGSGDGTFNLQQQFTSGGDSARSIFAYDFNSDGMIDLAVGNEVRGATDTVSIHLGNGDGTFGGPLDADVGNDPDSMASGDLNGDNITDLVAIDQAFNVPGTVSVLLGNDDGTFQPRVEFTVGEDPSGVTLGDFNGDGVLDIVTANSDSDDLSLLLGTGNGTFLNEQRIALGGIANQVAVADFNADGILDLAASALTPTSRLAVLLGNGDGTFSLQRLSGTANSARSIVTGDFNRDGLIDVVAGGVTAVTVHLNAGGGVFYKQGEYTVTDAESFAAADLNGDGWLDLVAYEDQDSLLAPYVNYVSVLLNRLGLPSSGGGQGAASPPAYEYDEAFSRITSSTDELGRTTTYDIDPNTGNTLTVNQPLGVTTSYTYTPEGLVKTISDDLGRVTEFEYDGLGRVERITYAKGTSDQELVRYEYDDAGNTTAMIDANNNRTEYEYDVLNRVMLMRDALGDVTRYEYDDAGNVISVEDARDNETSYEYDERNRVVRMTDADGNVTRSVYDEEGNLVRVTDPLGHTTTSDYDARNRIRKTTDPDDGVTQFKYDGDGNILSVIDAVGNVTSFAYDARDRMTREIDPRGKTTLYNHDGVDNLVSVVDRNGRETEYAFDELNRLDMETWTAANGAVVNTIQYAYDGVGNLLSVADASSVLTFTYDNRNRFISVDNDATPGAPDVELEYAYDAVGNTLSVTDILEGATAGVTTYRYDALNRVDRVTQSGAGVSDKRVDFGYDEIGKFESIARFSDLVGADSVAMTSFTYDVLNRLEQLNHVNDVESIAAYDFTYDAASRISSITDVDGQTTYSYDDRNQLTAADRDASDPRGDESYAYDANGNRTDSHLHDDGYQTETGNRLASDGTYDYEYDDEGNMIRRTDRATGDFRTFEWDHRNRLTRVADHNVSGTALREVEFTYDALDRRIAKSVDEDLQDGVDAFFTHFVYDREDVILDFVAPPGPNDPELVTRYLHGPAIDQVLAQEDVVAGETHWLLTDHLGTTRDIVDDSGTVRSHITYDAYGNVLDQTNSDINTRFLFTGREFDEESDLYYYRARYYDPSVGRFVSEDPIGFQGTDVNLFRYVGNSVVNASDASGLIREEVKHLLHGSAFDALVSKLAHASTENKVERWATRPGDLNALRHAYWQAMLSYLRGSERARLVGDVHEMGQCDGGYDPCDSLCRDTRADQFNNEIGREIGERYRKMYPGRPDLVRPLILRDVVQALRQERLDTGGEGGMGAPLEGPMNSLYQSPRVSRKSIHTRFLENSQGVT